MSTTPNLGLVNMEAGDRQPHITINDNYTRIDAFATMIGARAYHSADQSISNNTSTVLALNSERYDTSAIHDTSTNNSRLTVTSAAGAGKYRITGQVAYDTNSTGERQTIIRLNGSTVIADDTRMAVTGDFTICIVSTTYSLAVNDYVELIAFQLSGGSLNVKSAAQYSPEFSLEKIK